MTEPIELCKEQPFATWREAMRQPGAMDYYACAQHGAWHVMKQESAAPSARRQHRHLPDPEVIAADVIRNCGPLKTWRAETIAVKIIRQLRAEGYRLMQPCCEACDDDGISW